MNVSTAAICAFGAALLTIPSNAGEPDAFQEPLAAVQPDSKGWDFRVSIYGPFVGLDGTTRIGTTVIPVDVPFSDIAENLDAGMVIAADARYGKFSIVGDFIWLKLSTSAVPNPSTYAGSTFQQIVASLALGYELYEDGCWTVDALVGGAYTGLDVESDVTVAPPTGGSSTQYIEAKNQWVDPFVGFRFRYHAGEHWRIFGRIEYGGFGISSDQYFQALLGTGYKFNKSFGIYAAYRYLSVDYSQATFSYDVDTSGPQLGVVFTF